MKQSVSNSAETTEKEGEMSDHIWETFDGLFKTVHRQGRRVEELEARITDLERRLAERAGAVSSVSQAKQAQPTVSDMPVERAA
jgi:cell division septum initiation protein DivIVA